MEPPAKPLLADLSQASSQAYIKQNHLTLA
jgi:hypothetical protein